MSYEATGNEQIPLLILYGEENQELHSNTETNVKAIRIRTPTPYGTHHTKLMVLVYSDDSVRIVVSTANLVPSDWENRTQAQCYQMELRWRFSTNRQSYISQVL